MEEKEKHIIQEDWTLKLRERLTDYEEQVPEELWTKIEEALPPQQPYKRRVVFMSWLRRAAAVVILAATGAACWYMTNNSNITDTVAKTEGMKPTTIENDKRDDITLTSQQNYDYKDTPHTAKKHTITAVNGIGNIINNDKKNNTAYLKQEQHENSEYDTDNRQHTDAYAHNDNTKNNTDSKDLTNRIYNKKENKSNNAQQIKQRDRYIQQTDKRFVNTGRVTAGLYALNTMTNGKMSTNGVMMTANVMNIQATNGIADNKKRASNAPMYLANYKEETKHSLPISIGLSVSYDITDRLWIESGAVYTKLSSDFTHVMNNNVITESQTLHYIGVPVHVGYTAYRWHNLSIYGIAGGEADINVKSKRETEGTKTDADKDRVQLSVTAGAGAQYNILPQLGVYVEPGVKYYPDNGSKVDNIFKEKKINFSLQLGIRYNIN